MSPLETNLEFLRLSLPKTEKVEMEGFKILIDSGLKLIYDHSTSKPNNPLESDCAILFQMSLLKGLSLMELVGGINYANSSDSKIKLINIIDPFSVSTIVRGQFEAYCMFYNFLHQHTDQSQRDLLYNLWVIAGLNERQEFSYAAKSQLSKDKLIAERQRITLLIMEVKNSTIYKSNGGKSAKKIDNAIKNKKYRYYFENGELMDGYWGVLFKNSGVNNQSDLFKEIYPYLCSDTHPSQVSVFQFRDIFKKEEFRSRAMFGVIISKFIISFFIRDFCEYYPGAKTIFNGLPKLNQLLINVHNTTLRGNSYSIN